MLAASAEQSSGQYAQHGELGEVGQLADEVLCEVEGDEALEQGEDPLALQGGGVCGLEGAEEDEEDP